MSRLATSDEVIEAAQGFHQALLSFGRAPESERLHASERLYDLIVAPIWDLVGAKRTLIFVPDSALHYIPFAALRITRRGDSRFLAEDHDVAVAPSLGMLLSEMDRSPPVRQMLIVDDPVYGPDDARIHTAQTRPHPQTAPSTAMLLRGSRAGRTLPRLPDTAREASVVASLLRSGDVDRLEGLTATRDRFLNIDLSRYRFIHVATHALTDSEVPQLSALVLSTLDQLGRPIEGHVLAADFVGVRLNADLVVLSACDTALGKDVAGEGLVGLQYVVLARGARASLSSLWEVSDQATANLMQRFYEKLLREHRSAAAALSGAMRAMMRSQFHDPAFWAAFTLVIGDKSSLERS
jgi:CHAT domain-containing protein